MKFVNFGSALIICLVLLTIISGCVTSPESITLPSPTSTPSQDLPPSTLDAPISTWFRIFEERKENSGSDLIFTPDGGTLIVGGIGQLKGKDLIGGVMLLRTSPDGELLWQQIYGGEGFDFGSSIIQTPEGGYLIAGVTTSFGNGGSDGYLIKVDQKGNLVWSKTFGGELNESINSILSNGEGGYYLIGNVEDPNDFITDPGAAGYGGFGGRSNIYLVCVDSVGNQKWSKVIQSDQNMVSSDGLLTSNGDILVLATVITYPRPDNDMVLFRFDREGNQIWAHTWEEGDLSGGAMTEDQDGNILITGIAGPDHNSTSDVLLLKLDANGNEIWSAEYGSQNLYEIGRDVLVMRNGSYAILIQKTSSLFSPKSSTFIQAVDPDGNLQWESIVEIGYPIKSGALFNHPNGGFIIVGNGVNPNGEFRTVLIRTDIYGSLD